LTLEGRVCVTKTKMKNIKIKITHVDKFEFEVFFS